MNEALETALTALITKSVQGVETAGEFLMTEIPEVIQQLLMWHGVLEAVHFIIGLFGLLFIIYYIFYMIRNTYILNKYISDITEDEEKHFPKMVIGGILCFISFLVTATFLNLTWLKIWIAPKVWLLEYAASLTKSVTG